MSKHFLNTKGFGLVGVLIVVVALAVVAGGGAYVYHKNHNTKTPANATTPHTSTSGKTSTILDPYAGWKTFALAATKLALKYPQAWTIEDTPQCDGATTYTINAPATEIQQAGLTSISSYGLAVTVNVEVAGTPTCAPSAASREGVTLGSQSQSQIVSAGALKGKYVVVNGDSGGTSGIDLFDHSYKPTQKIAESGLLVVNGTNIQVTSALVAGQNPASIDTSSFVSSQLYKDTVSILNSFSS